MWLSLTYQEDAEVVNIAKHLSHVCLVVHDDLETAVSEVAAEGEDLAGEAVVDGVQAPADNI